MTLSKTVIEKQALNYAAESRIYPEAPDALFITLRGGGITKYNITMPSKPVLEGHYEGIGRCEGQLPPSQSTPALVACVCARACVPLNPCHPFLVLADAETGTSNPHTHTHTHTHNLAGQDRIGDLMVVATLGDKPDSGLVLLNVSETLHWPPTEELGRIKISLPGALHVKLYVHARLGDGVGIYHQQRVHLVHRAAQPCNAPARNHFRLSGFFGNAVLLNV